jgi:hypothetical protein
MPADSSCFEAGFMQLSPFCQYHATVEAKRSQP